jgi:hypothetical protein
MLLHSARKKETIPFENKRPRRLEARLTCILTSALLSRMKTPASCLISGWQSYPRDTKTTTKGQTQLQIV